MISKDIGNLLQELQGAEDFRDLHTRSLQGMWNRLTGPFFRSTGSTIVDEGEFSQYDPEPTLYEYVALTAPRLVAGDPRVKVTTRRVGPQSEVAEAMGFGLNRWIVDNHFQEVLLPVVTDSLLGYGVMMVTSQRNETIESPTMGSMQGKQPRWPQVERVSPKRFFRDPGALSLREARYVGHMWVRDKEDLLKEAREAPESAGWNVEQISALVAQGGEHDQVKRSSDRDIPDRKEVVCYDMYFPGEGIDGEDLPDGFGGTIYTFAKTGSRGDGKPGGSLIREPRLYYGPKRGPYVVFDFYDVADTPYRLAPLLAIEGNSKSLNRVSRAIADQLAAYKRMVGVKDKNTQSAISKVNSDGVVVLGGEDLRMAVEEFSTGGAAREMLDGWAFYKESHDRYAGITDALRGMVGGQGTATEQTLAASGSDVRFDFLEGRNETSVIAVLSLVAWNMYHDDRVTFPLGSEAEQSTGVNDPWFEGGSTDDKSGATYSDLELEIEPYSLSRASEGLFQRRTLDYIRLGAETAQIMAVAPWYRGDMALKDAGEAMKMPKREYIDMQVFQQVMQMRLEAEAEGQNRFGKDVGQQGNQTGGDQTNVVGHAAGAQSAATMGVGM
jgi:hypothetical protein